MAAVWQRRISPPLRQVCLIVYAIVSVYAGGGTKARTNYLDRFKMASCPFEAWWLFNPKPDRNLPLWSQKWKENLLQNTRLQRNGRQSPRSDDNMNDSCAKILYMRKTAMCGVLNSNNGLWATMGPLETVGNRVVVGWRFRKKAICWNESCMIHLGQTVSHPPPIVWHFVWNMQHIIE